MLAMCCWKKSAVITPINSAYIPVWPISFGCNELLGTHIHTHTSTWYFPFSIHISAFKPLHRKIENVLRDYRIFNHMFTNIFCCLLMLSAVAIVAIISSILIRFLFYCPKFSGFVKHAQWIKAVEIVKSTHKHTHTLTNLFVQISSVDK